MVGDWCGKKSPANFPGVFIEADLADRKKTHALGHDLIARGDVVGIVNNVGVARHESVDAVDPDVLATVMNLNVRLALQLTQALLPGMRAANSVASLTSPALSRAASRFAQATPRQRQR